MESGLRHQINNHLAVIYGYIQLIERKSTGNPDIEKYISVIKKESEKLNELIAATKKS